MYMSDVKLLRKVKKKEPYKKRYMREWLSKHKEIRFYIPIEEYKKLSLLMDINNISVKELILDVLRSRDINDFLLKVKGRVFDILEMKNKLELKEKQIEEREKKLEARLQRLKSYISYIKELEDTVLKSGFSLHEINRLRIKYGFERRDFPKE